jgi:5-formyltetrahydrofolate cyclo-ligase
MRSNLLHRRSARSEAERREAGSALARHAASRWPAPRLVAAYLSVGTEPPTGPLLDHFIDAGATVIVPVVDGDDLDWAEFSPATQLVAGPLGINQPAGQRLGAAKLAEADLVLLPALAVDRRGNRLGRGKGYYDRALAAVTGPPVAIVYDEEYVELVPAEPHDRPVDGVLRPAGVICIGDGLAPQSRQ